MNLLNIAELKTHLSEVITKVCETGRPVIIGKYGKPIAKITPFTEEEKRSVGFGKHLGMTTNPQLQQQVDEALDTETLNGFYP